MRRVTSNYVVELPVKIYFGFRINNSQSEQVALSYQFARFVFQGLTIESGCFGRPAKVVKKKKSQFVVRMILIGRKFNSFAKGNLSLFILVGVVHQ